MPRRRKSKRKISKQPHVLPKVIVKQTPPTRPRININELLGHLVVPSPLEPINFPLDSRKLPNIPTLGTFPFYGCMTVLSSPMSSSAILPALASIDQLPVSHDHCLLYFRPSDRAAIINIPLTISSPSSLSDSLYQILFALTISNLVCFEVDPATDLEYIVHQLTTAQPLLFDSVKFGRTFPSDTILVFVCDSNYPVEPILGILTDSTFIPYPSRNVHVINDSLIGQVNRINQLFSDSVVSFGLTEQQWWELVKANLSIAYKTFNSFTKYQKRPSIKGR
ncbi:hypothetical protein P9112_003255 [Eukaryota sp. TZLM1-RC]